MQDVTRKVQRPEYIAAQFLFTDDFDMVLYRDKTTAGSAYAASGDEDRDLRAVTKYLSR